jgi:hypothetical protein
MPSLIGTHRIGYRDDVGTDAFSSVTLPVRVEFSERSYVHEKRFGTDKWVLCVGEVLDDLLRDATANAELHPGCSLLINELEVFEFGKGLFQWSSHMIGLQFAYELRQNDELLKRGLIWEEGRGSGREFGWMTYVPILGNLNFDKGIELALSRCLRRCLSSLADQVNGVLGARTSSPVDARGARPGAGSEVRESGQIRPEKADEGSGIC